jgi:hypothetical protein
MYVVIRRFRHMRSMPEAARRAENGIGQVLKQVPGFQGYHVFDAGDGGGGSISLFDSREAAIEANARASAWAQASLIDLIDGDPEITVGEILATVDP